MEANTTPNLNQAQALPPSTPPTQVFPILFAFLKL